MVEKSIPLKSRIVSIFELVRDIPYGSNGSRTPEAVLQSGRGTCSGKHILLGRLYELMGVRVKYLMTECKIDSKPDMFPAHLQDSLPRKTIYDFHNFIQIYYRKWITVDATFDVPLKKCGIAVNENWNPDKDCIMAFTPGRIVEVNNLISEKEKAISNLSPEQQLDRSTFFRLLSEWFDEVRQEKEAKNNGN